MITRFLFRLAKWPLSLFTYNNREATSHWNNRVFQSNRSIVLAILVEDNVKRGPKNMDSTTLYALETQYFAESRTKLYIYSS